MSLQIFINRDGQQYGPYDEQQALQMLQAGELVPGDLAWHEGLAEWTTLDSVVPAAVPAVQTRMPRVFRPPGAPAQVRSILPDEADTPRPWRRYFARKMDYLIFGGGVGFVAAAAGRENMIAQYNDFLVGIVLVIVWTFVEAPLLAATGTTPGKFLFGLRVVRVGGGRPALVQAFVRAWMVLLMGLGLGIPILSLLTCVFSYQILEKYGRTSWDDAGNLRVQSSPRAWWVWLLVWLVTALVLALVLVAVVFLMVATRRVEVS